jgi:asparagine synthase (glutamine-hydrolysing)
MCGIAGKASAEGSVDRTLLERMCAAIEHRGPDSRGTFLDDGVGLGIQRLRVIDLETGDQPIANEDGSVVVVLNGEIYNYRELRAQLEDRGHRFSTRSDTEVLVHLYEDRGDDCVDALRGMFAFAVWDRRRRRLLLARDRLGKKPLFYAERGRQLWFASEARAILEDPEVPRDMDPAAIDAFLRLQYVPSPASAFRALRKLPPAHRLVWEDGRSEISRYWRLSMASDESYGSEEEMKERIRAELLEATRLRLRSDVPLGAFLSGGVDSSAVVAAMAKTSSTAVKTFSIGFDVASFDETEHAREVADLFGTDHEEFRVEPEAVSVLPRLVWHYGEPFGDQAAIPTMYLSELTRRHVTVALTGDGGDENFAGYLHHRSALRFDRLSVVPSGAARLAVRPLDMIGDGPAPNGFRSRARRSAHVLSAPTPGARYERILSHYYDSDLAGLYTPEFRAGLGGGDRVAAHAIRGPYEASNATGVLGRALDTDINSLLPGAFLVKVDIASMAHALEVRSPLLDHRFVEMAAGLPDSVKLDQGTSKRIFKDALRPWIPDHILDRAKQGFAVPVSEWLRGRLRELPRDVLLDTRAVQRGIFRPEAVRRIIDRHESGAEDMGKRIWLLIQLELWFQTFVDARRTEALALTV